MMRISTAVASFMGIVILLVPHTPLVNAGWPENLSKQDKEKLKKIMSGRLELPAEMELFVKYHNKRGRQYAKLFSKDGKFAKIFPKRNVVSLHPSNSTALKKLMRFKHIAYVEPVHTVQALPFITDLQSQGGRQVLRQLEETLGYGIALTQASELWDIEPPSKMTICVVDSGYALGHPDLPNSSNNVTGTTTGTGDWFEDEYGHGTHCAGIIGAIGNNERGVAGVIPDPTKFKLHIGKSLDSQGFGSEADMMDAFEGCIDAGANVISMSLGIDRYSETVLEACKDAYDAGTLIVSAAGNGGGSDYNYPASYSTVMSVAAVDRDLKTASFSQYNDQVEIAGPGVNVLSTVPNNRGQGSGYDTWSGTSMATPFVAGIAAVVWSHFPECSNNQIRNVLLRTARRTKGNVGCTEESGFGIVQAKDAYALLKNDGCNAGDTSTNPLSDGAFGGCSQDPSYTPPPTSAPTAFSCEDHVFLFTLETDEYGEETSWDLTNSTGEVLGSGSGYRSTSSFEKRICLPSDYYTFTIRDSQGDGLCCSFGEGSFSVSYDGQLVLSGGNFSEVESVSFGRLQEITPAITPRPTPVPSSGSMAACKDDAKWRYTTPKGKQKPCKYLLPNPAMRCSKLGVSGSGNETSGYDSCPVSCGRCPGGTEAQPLSKAPSPAISHPPPEIPTSSSTPTPSPISSETLYPTLPPTVPPAFEPTLLPTATPTVPPTSIPTLNPTTPPSLPPSSSPTSSPTMHPSPNPTLEPTSQPSPSPTKLPTSSPTKPPSLRPTSWPTFSPTRRPTSLPTEKPSPPPSSVQTPVPTGSSSGVDGRVGDPGEPGTPGLPGSPGTPGAAKPPILAPTFSPSSSPTPRPTTRPTGKPTVSPTARPTEPTIAPPTVSPASNEIQISTNSACLDDPTWFTWYFFIKKTCDVLAYKEYLCPMEGEDEFGTKSTGFESCPKACKSCSSGDNPVPPSEETTVTKFEVIGEDGSFIMELTNGTVIDRSAVGRITIRAQVSGAVESVVFSFDGNQRFKLEMFEPWNFLGSNFWDPVVGNHEVTATPYTSRNDGQGPTGMPLTASFTVTEGTPGATHNPSHSPNTPAVTRFELRKEGDKVVRVLTNGDVIDKSASGKIDILVETAGNVQSVVFSFDGKQRFKIENAAPWKLFGKDMWDPVIGSHEVTATPYDRDEGNGQAGKALSLSFKVAATLECKDDEDWVRKTDSGRSRYCDWFAGDIEKRCPMKGDTKEGKRTTAYESCPKSCGMC